MTAHISRRLATILLFLLTLNAEAQQLLPVNQKTYADSLTKVSVSKVSDSLKANANYLLSDYWRVTDSLKSSYYLNLGKKLSKNHPYLQAVYFFYEGQYYYNKDKVKAANSFKIAQGRLLKFKSKQSSLMQAAAWYNYAIMRKDTEGYPFVMDVLTRYSIPLAKQAGNQEKLAHYYSQFGTILMYNAQFDQAAMYNQMAIDILEKGIPESSALLPAYIAASNNFIYADKKLPAKKMLDAAKKIMVLHPDSVNYPLYYLNEAQFNIYTENFDEALNSAEKGILIAKKGNQTDVLQLLYFRKYEALLHLKLYEKAKVVLMQIMEDGIFTKDANNRKTMYAQLVDVNELMKNDKDAYTWLKKYSAISDSLAGIRLNETVRAIEAKYQNTENQNKIVTLKSEKAKQALEVNEQKKYTGILLCACLLFLIGAVLSYLLYYNNKKFARQKELNHQQELIRIDQEEQLKITKAMLDGEDKERERVAKELHDGLGGMLAGVKINFSGWASAHLTTEKRTEFDKIMNQLDRSVSELRGVARNLMPESLLKFGLETALKDLSEFFMNEQLDIDLQTYDIQNNILLSTQLNIYRIVQELLSNAVKHAGATSILLQCTQASEDFFITIEDNGKGFDAKSVALKKGMGMGNIRNRVGYLGGTLDVESQPGEGTTINIELKIDGE